MLKKELTFALNYALNKGFQIHPDAFKILENIDVKRLEKIIREIIREKTKQKMYQINQDDLEMLWTFLTFISAISIGLPLISPTVGLPLAFLFSYFIWCSRNCRSKPLSSFI